VSSNTDSPRAVVLKGSANGPGAGWGPSVITGLEYARQSIDIVEERNVLIAPKVAAMCGGGGLAILLDAYALLRRIEAPEETAKTGVAPTKRLVDIEECERGRPPATFKEFPSSDAVVGAFHTGSVRLYIATYDVSTQNGGNCWARKAREKSPDSYSIWSRYASGESSCSNSPSSSGSSSSIQPSP